MPIVKQKQGKIDPLEMDEAGEVAVSIGDIYEPPTKTEVVKAAFRKENSLVSAVSNHMTLENNFPEVPGYDPLERDRGDIEGYEIFADQFIHSKSPQETALIKQRIDNEFKDRQTLEAGGVVGFVAQIAAGITDPVTLLTMFSGIGAAGGLTAKGATATTTVLKTAGKASAVGFTSEVLAETAKHASQKTRTLEESLVNIGGATLLSGIFGGTAGGLSARKFNKMAKAIDDNVAEEIPTLVANSEVQPKDYSFDLVSAGKIEEWGVSPLVRTSVSKSFTTKKVVSELMESPLVTKGNIEGEAAAPIGGAAETVIKKREQNLLAESRIRIEDFYTQYRGGKGATKRIINDIVLRNRAGKLTFGEFREEISKALIRGDVSDIPEVQSAAQFLRSNVIDPLKDDAIANGLLSKDVSVDTAASYLTRMYSQKKIIAERPRWNNIVDTWLSEGRESASEGLPDLISKAGEFIDDEIPADLGLREGLEFSVPKIEAKVSGIETQLKQKIEDIEGLRKEVAAQKSQVQRIDKNISVASNVEKELHKELTTVLDRFMKFRPDVDTEKFAGIAQKETDTINKLTGQIEKLQKAETELKNEANSQLKSFLSSRTEEAQQKNKAFGQSFLRIEKRLAKIRNDITLKQGDRNNLISQLDDTLKKTKSLKPGNKAKAVELSGAIRRLQKRIKPRQEKLSVLRRELDDIVNEVKASRVKISEQIGLRADIEGELRTTRALGKQLINQLEKNKLALLSDDELKLVRNEMTDNILGVSSGRAPYDVVALKRGPLKERTFGIPDVLIEDFLERDIDLVMNQYVKTMVPDIELTRLFGRADMADQIDAISKEWDSKIDIETNAKKLKSLQKQKESDIEDISAMRDRLRGTYRVPEDPNKFFIRAGRALRDINFLRMLGGMTLSAIPDPARTVAVNGLKPVGKGLLTLASSPRRFNIGRKQAKTFAVGLDMVLNSRASSMAEIADVYARGTAFERGLRATSDVFSKMTLMSQWNSAWKQFAGVVTADRLLAESVNAATGTIKKNALRRMAQAGIGKDMAVRIAKEFEKHGDDGVLKLSNAHLWTDKEAFDTFSSAVLKDVDRAIATPGKGETPLWTSSEAGKLIFQFKTFAGSAHHKILLADLQHRDLAALNGFLLSAALGSVSYGLKNWVAGRDIPTEPEKVIIESLDRSGAFGYFWDINNTIEKMSRGEVGVNPLLGAPPMSRYASRNWMGALLGPSFGTAKDIGDIAGGVASGEFNKKDLRRLRQMLPGQNLFYMRRLLNELEEKAGRGLPQ